jgi:hypothetical protein
MELGSPSTEPSTRAAATKFARFGWNEMSSGWSEHSMESKYLVVMVSEHNVVVLEVGICWL